MGTFLGHPAVEFMCVVPAGSGIAMIIQVAPTGQLLDSAGRGGRYGIFQEK